VIGEETRAAGLFGDRICSPVSCSEAWTVIGMSKNGGPLLRIVL
jgi:hypothetical protein